MQICNYTSRKKNGGCRGGANHKPNRASFGSATSGYKRNPPAHHERVAKIYTKNKLSSFSVSWRQRRAPFNTAPPPSLFHLSGQSCRTSGYGATLLLCASQARRRRRRCAGHRHKTKEAGPCIKKLTGNATPEMT